MSNVVLAIDPGITTGWAVLDEAGEIRATSVWGTHELRASLDALIRGLHLTGNTVSVVVEKMPTGRTGPLAQKLEAVRRDISYLVDEVYELRVTHVGPGEWKPSRVARTTKLPGRWQGEPLMTHQKDAIRMGRYAMEKTARAD